MSIANFIPTMWDAGLMTAFHEQAIAAGLVGTEYQGTLARGSTVTINTAGEVEVKDYKAGVQSDGAGGTVSRTTEPDAVNTTSEDLVIDQEKSFDFLIDDIDRAQAAGSLETFTRGAGVSMAQDVDKWLFALMAGSAASKTDATTGELTGDAVHDVIVDLRKVLNKAFMPKDSRALFVNSDFEAMLLRSDAKLSSVDTSGTPEGLREATLGRYLGFTIYTTENLGVTDKPFAMAAYMPTVQFVSQVSEIEAMRAQNTFADRLRGLHVYGGKVLRAGKGLATYTYSGE